MEAMELTKELLYFAKENPLVVFSVILILLLVNIALYKKSSILQKIYNGIINYVLVFRKREFIMLATFTKKKANYSEVKKEYQEQGCLYIDLDLLKHFNTNGSIEIEKLQKILSKKKSKMETVINRSRNASSLIYLGFPHVPLAFLDGYHLKDTDNPILFEYQGEDSETLNKGFYELKKKYNTVMKITDNYNLEIQYDNEIALKIEQSFPILDEGVRDISGSSQVVSLGIDSPSRWNINNYAQIDLYQQKFVELLSKLNKSGVEKIHLFATTPVSLSFSLGRVIEHYHPEIILYNFNNNAYDWAINLRSQEIITFN